jgi:hypothetical protein
MLRSGGRKWSIGIPRAPTVSQTPIKVIPLLRTSPARLRAVNAPRLNPKKKSSSPGS